MSIQTLLEERKYPVLVLCKIARVSRSGYCKWLSRKKTQREIQNEMLLELIKRAYERKGGILGWVTGK